MLNRAIEIESLLGLDDLLKHGIRPRRVTFDVSHSIVVYPHKNQMGEILHGEIFNKPLEDVSLYFHFPFCTGKCKYCHYVSFPKLKDAAVESYLSLLKKEIALMKETGQLDSVRIRTVFFGGGTPTCLAKEHLEDIIKFIFDEFDVPKDIEKTIEASPETVTLEKAQMLKDIGINRVSIGFQDFNDAVLRNVGRRHDSRTAIEAYRTIKDVGIGCVNIDLMLGLPDQNAKTVYGMLDGVFEVMPDSITVYSNRLKPHVPMYRTFINEPLRFPSDKELLRMRIMLQEGLKEMGYKQELLRWFVKGCNEELMYQRHKWGETTDVLGFGLSAYSFVNNCQYINHDSMSLYARELNSMRLPIQKGKCLSREEAMRRSMIFGLRAGLNKKRFFERHGTSPEDVFGNELKDLEELGLIESDKREIRFTYKGALFGEEICGKFAYEKMLPAT